MKVRDQQLLCLEYILRVCCVYVYQFWSATLTELGPYIFLPLNQDLTDKAQGRMTLASGSFESVAIYNQYTVELEIRSLLS